jgi:hypothetical protein
MFRARPCKRSANHCGTPLEIVRLQDLYNEFVEEASTCYVHALQHDEADIPGLVRLYAKLGRMRILSSPKVLPGIRTSNCSG